MPRHEWRLAFVVTNHKISIFWQPFTAFHPLHPLSPLCIRNPTGLTFDYFEVVEKLADRFFAYVVIVNPKLTTELDFISIRVNFSVVRYVGIVYFANSHISTGVSLRKFISLLYILNFYFFAHFYPPHPLRRRYEIFGTGD